MELKKSIEREDSIMNRENNSGAHQGLGDKDIDKINQEGNIEIWEDVVTIKDLLISLILCMITTFGGYGIGRWIAKQTAGGYQPLLFGLLGAVCGFILVSMVIKPKREFELEN